MDREANLVTREWKKVEDDLNNTGKTWNDATRNEFESKYIKDLARQVERYAQILAELEDTFEYVKRSLP